LSVIFCDLVGSTALATRLDPEDLHGVITRYQHCCAEVIERAGGFVAKNMGDGVLAYFGYPRAHEDDAERAVRAGLALVDEVGRLSASIADMPQARVGIATGLVVVAGKEQEIVGETLNVAFRLQAVAEPGTVVIAESTRRLVGRLFEYHELGPLPLKGFAGAIGAWSVVGESGVASRFEALRSRQTPLVGREAESALLRQRWEQAVGGDGRAVMLMGEAGIGKSRLIAVLEEQIAGTPHVTMGYFCSPHHSDSALYPLINHI